MKFWNKQPDKRATWAVVVVAGIQAGADPKYDRAERKVWCQRQPGGKFWASNSGRHWFFEQEIDAVAFTLVWA